MALIIEISIISAILILGITIASEEGMVLYDLRMKVEDLYDRKGYLILKPLFLCVWCMASIYSSLGYVFAWVIGDLHIFNVRIMFCYPIVVCLTSIISGLTWSVYELIETKKQFLLIKIKRNEQDNKESSGITENPESAEVKE